MLEIILYGVTDREMRYSILLETPLSSYMPAECWLWSHC